MNTQNTEKNFDVTVIGSGPGGYVAAIRAAQLGFKVAIIERSELGGICLNWGCIPTKALLRSAEVYRNIKHAKDYGLVVGNASADINAVVARSRGVAKQLSNGIAFLMKKNKVEVIAGTAQLTGNGGVDVKLNADGSIQKVKSKNIIIATGARARVIPGFETDEQFVWSYREALVAKEVPAKMLVMGSGAIGVEFASFFSTLGSEVTIVEMQDRIMPVEDAEISAMAQKAFEKQGIKILTATKVLGMVKNGKTATVTLEDSKGVKTAIEVNKVISAVGIVANIENLGLEKTKIKTDKGRIVVNQYCATDEAGVYAIGDVIDGPWLAHKASHEGVMVAEKIAGLTVHPTAKNKIPGCTYAHPQVASVGLTEAKAKEMGLDIKVGRFPFIGNGKAIAMGEAEGMIKTIFNAKTGELLGAHMIGLEVTEMIQGFVIAMNLETTHEELMHTVFAHPTVSESMHESVLAAFNRVIHV